MPTATVLDFVMPAPTFVSTDSLSAVVARLMKQSYDQWVLLNDQRQPTGWIRSVELLKLGWNHHLQPGRSRIGIPTELVRSLPLVCDTESVYDLRNLGDTTPLPEAIAIVDREGCYLGLLNQAEFWRFIAAQGLETASKSAASAWSRPVDPSPTALLVQVLDHIPLPLMLQTSSGAVIAQNNVWQERIGDVPYLYQTLQGMEAHPHLTDTTPNPCPWVMGQGPSRQPTGSPSTPKPSRPLKPSQCRLNRDTNTCVCVCPTAEGLDRLWQFTTVSLGDGRSLHQDSAYDLLWLVVAQDYTEQQRVGQELAAKNADLIQLNRLKDEFLACISHELKTPLTSILGLSSLLKDQSIGAMSDRQTRYAQLIYQSSRHLMLIVNDILDLTRIETGQMELMLEPVNLELVCHRAYEQVIQSHSAIVPERTAEGTEDIPAYPTIEVDIRTSQACLLADELRLRQMLANLLSNAIKFTTDPGRVGLEVEDWGHWLAFTVWDTGIGIPADKQHLIFQKFQQLEHPLTRRFEGTGLGLVITQRLARLHGGEVTFISKEGEGSRFTILLPVVPPQAAQSLDPEESAAILPHRRSPNNRLILVMESVPPLLDDITYHLGKLGYKVAIARSGTEALEKTRQLQPAMVFLDPVLPQLSGWDVLTLLKSDDDTSHIPVIAMTTQAESQRAEAAGVDGVLSLPIDSDALERLMSQRLAIVPPVSEHYPQLTVLHLGQPNPWSELDLPEADWDASWQLASGRSPLPDLNQLLHPYHCRVLEVDDIDQADVLSRVWRPDVVLLSDGTADPMDYVQQVRDCAYLSNLPIITLTPELTQAANQCPDLGVFPCLDPAARVTGPNRDEAIPALLEVIRVATGMYWTPHVLVVDVNSTAEVPSLQPPLQYLQQSGIASVRAHSPTEVSQALDQQSGDLLLLCTNTLSFNPALVQVIQVLEQATIRPPVLVWIQQGRQYHVVSPESWLETQTLRHRLEAIAAQILPLDSSVEEVMLRIQRTLGEQYAQRHS
jgi:signal transduction histidine kinase/CheY-like chemotaxis protein